MASSSVPLDLLSPELVHDPVPMIARMHAEAPIFFDERLHGWMLGGWHDIKTLEREPRLSAQRSGYIAALSPPALQERVVPLANWYGEWMVMRDGADHRRLRQLAAHAFTPRNIQRLQARMLAVIEPILDAALARGEMEVLGELAFPLPRTIICEMLGIPKADVGLFSEWSPTISNILGATLTSEAVIERVTATRARIHEYFTALIDERRRAPREGEILTSLVQASEVGDSLTENEIIDLVVFIMVGAYDTTAYLIANGLHLLLRHPEQLAAVRADPTKIDGWIEETLRCEPSITINTRSVGEAFEYKGHRFEPGQMVYFLPLVANRDPERFPEPNRFDIARENAGEHISFGFGPHFCIGAPLARMEARLAFQRILARAQQLGLPEQEIERAPSMVIRALQALRVSMH
jgi:cytochrome P450